MGEKKNLFINPIKTQQTVQRQIAAPNVAENVGLERQFVARIEESIYKYKELRDTEQILGAKAAHQEQITDGQDFLFRMKHDKEFAKDPNNFVEFTKRYEERKELFGELAENNEYADDITQIALENIDKEYGRIHLINMEHRLAEDKKAQQEQFFYYQDAVLKNSSKFMLNGNKEEGLAYNLETQKGWIDAAKRGDISVPQAIELCKKAKWNYLSSDVNSNINIEGGLEELDRLGKMNFDEFEKEYEKMKKASYGDFKQLLTVEDFNYWKNQIDSAKRDIAAKAKQEKDLMKFNQYQQEKDIRDNPVSYAAKHTPVTSFGIYSDLPISQQIQNRDNFAVEVTNNKFGTKYTSVKEMEFGDSLPVTIDKSNSRIEQYNDPSLDGAGVMQVRAGELKDFTITNLEDIENRMIVDGQYGGTIIPGAKFTEKYYQANTAYRLVYDTTYSAPNKIALQQVGEVDVNILDSLGKFEKVNMRVPGEIIVADFKGREIAIEGPTKNRLRGKEDVVALGGKLQALRFAAINGDKRAERLYGDIERIISDTIIVTAVQEDNGFIDKDLANKMGNEKLEGLSVGDLTQKQKQAYVNTKVGDAKTLAKALKGTLVLQAAEEGLDDFQTIDVGNGGFININKNLDGKEVAKQVLGYMRNIPLYTKDDLEKGVKMNVKYIRPVSYLGSDKICFKYKGELLYKNNGEVAMFDVGGE